MKEKFEAALIEACNDLPHAIVLAGAHIPDRDGGAHWSYLKHLGGNRLMDADAFLFCAAQIMLQYRAMLVILAEGWNSTPARMESRMRHLVSSVQRESLTR